MRRNKVIFWQFLIGLIPFIYLLIIWHNLPQNVPTHYNINFKADRFGSRSELLLIQLFMFVVLLGTSILLINLHKIDPKKRYFQTNPLMIKISWIIVVFITLISTYIIYKAATHVKANVINYSDKYLIAFICLLLTLFGNFMNSIKQNYFVGIRTPWNLKDENNWRKTHYLGSKIWFFGGLIMFILVLILPLSVAPFIVISGLIPLCIIPFWYSYHIFKQNKVHE